MKYDACYYEISALILDEQKEIIEEFEEQNNKTDSNVEIEIIVKVTKATEMNVFLY